MIALRLDDLSQYSDVLRSRDGVAVTVRFLERRDAEKLQNYFRSLSVRSRYNRFFSALSELPGSLLEHFVQLGEQDQFSVIATMSIEGFETIVGEARYALHADDGTFEFGLSIDDRWQRRGIGSEFLKNLECRAAALGATRLFGDTLRSNEAMVALARKSGFAFGHYAGDWKLVRFEKQIAVAREEIPCASWRLLAASHDVTAATLAG